MAEEMTRIELISIPLIILVLGVLGSPELLFRG